MENFLSSKSGYFDFHSPGRLAVLTSHCAKENHRNAGFETQDFHGICPLIDGRGNYTEASDSSALLDLSMQNHATRGELFEAICPHQCKTAEFQDKSSANIYSNKSKAATNSASVRLRYPPNRYHQTQLLRTWLFYEMNLGLRNFHFRTSPA
jgi:hypothetical protein